MLAGWRRQTKHSPTNEENEDAAQFGQTAAAGGLAPRGPPASDSPCADLGC